MPDNRIRCLELLFLSLTIIVIKLAGINAKDKDIKNNIMILFLSCLLFASYYNDSFFDSAGYGFEGYA